MSEITRTQPAVVRILCSDGAEYDQFVYSFDHTEEQLFSIVEEEVGTLYRDDETGDVKTLDDALLNMFEQGIRLLGIRNSKTTY